MKTPTVIAVLFGGSILGLFAKDSPLVEAENARYKAELDAGITKLNASHVERLSAILSKVTATGDLDGAVAIRDQIKAILEAPNFPDPAVKQTVPVAGPLRATRVQRGDVTFLKGDWFLKSGGNSHNFTFDDKGNFQSHAWGGSLLKWDGNILATSAASGKYFKVIDSNTLEAVNQKGSKTGEMLVRKSAESSADAATPAKPGNPNERPNPFGKAEL